jgi:hypothetical protein
MYFGSEFKIEESRPIIDASQMKKSRKFSEFHSGRELDGYANFN